MPSKMLIDTVHPEETRVAVLRGNRVEEFDFESSARKQLRGNIYLAKVTRVEPSLQAAFVDYGGNRHGFLAFSEIHPDYYQIPVADRQELLRQEEEDQKSEAIADEAEDSEPADNDDTAEAEATEPVEETADGDDAEAEEDASAVTADDGEAETEALDGSDDGNDDDAEADQPDAPETVATNDAFGEVPIRRARRPRPYKIQEVIKRRQVLLVQVVKEERGNKGAALTTYLSLAGRYSVLMPNTARGGGISRKISNATDRKRLKQIATDLDVPEGMGVILRTAGANRTKAEVRRDFEYLLRLWENVRTLTLESHAPCLVYEEGNLVKRAIRDLYSKDINEVMVSGDDGYKDAKDLMRMLMPSHAKNVKSYKDATPLFVRYGIEAQLDGLFQPQVTLKSGGYIVINQTEALVAIDVNSGRATREHSIEDTALKTNLEAADEVARQLRLRDLAGLIVVDFIDMEENRNNRAVERRLKDALKADRARIQVGRISSFGLLEMSRQRLRSSVLEGSTDICPHCSGTGVVRSVESVTLHVLRVIETAVKDARTNELTAYCAPNAAFYILNHKRDYLRHFEEDHGIEVHVVGDTACVGVDCRIESGGDAVKVRQQPPAAVTMDTDDAPAQTVDADSAEDKGDGERKRRRRRRRKPRAEKAEAADSAETSASDEDEDSSEADAEDATIRAEDDEPRTGRRSRRRGRRGGRRNRKTSTDETANGDDEGELAEAASSSETSEDEPTEVVAQVSDGEDETTDATAAEKPKRRSRSRRSKTASSEAAETVEETAPDAAAETEGQPIELTEPAVMPPAEDAPVAIDSDIGSGEPEPAPEIAAPSEAVPTEPAERRTGWWQRTFSAKK